jgi:hypothetical protein
MVIIRSDSCHSKSCIAGAGVSTGHPKHAGEWPATPSLEARCRGVHRGGWDPQDVFIVETQKTRTGNDANQQKTRPYKYGELDIIAVSMQPYTQLWNRYMFSLQRWLLPAKNEAELATLQPVSMVPNPFWTKNFETAVNWFRMEDNGRSLLKLSNKKQGSFVQRL